MKAVIELDVPEWQIGQNVTVYFPDTMMKHGKCELLKEQEADRLEIAHEMIAGSIFMYQGKELVRCKDCVNRHDSINCRMFSEGMDTSDDWFCADGERK